MKTTKRKPSDLTQYSLRKIRREIRGLKLCFLEVVQRIVEQDARISLLEKPKRTR